MNSKQLSPWSGQRACGQAPAVAVSHTLDNAGHLVFGEDFAAAPYSQTYLTVPNVSVI